MKYINKLLAFDKLTKVKQYLTDEDSLVIDKIISNYSFDKCDFPNTKTCIYCGKNYFYYDFFNNGKAITSTCIDCHEYNVARKSLLQPLSNEICLPYEQRIDSLIESAEQRYCINICNKKPYCEKYIKGYDSCLFKERLNFLQNLTGRRCEYIGKAKEIAQKVLTPEIIEYKRLLIKVQSKINNLKTKKL